MAILPVRLCRIFRRSFFFLFPFGKCPLALIAFIILLNHRQQTPWDASMRMRRPLKIYGEESFMYRICGGDFADKMRLLMGFTDRSGDVADPWYTDDFEATWQDVLAGCQGLLKSLVTRCGQM